MMMNIYRLETDSFLLTSRATSTEVTTRRQKSREEKPSNAQTKRLSSKISNSSPPRSP